MRRFTLPILVFTLAGLAFLGSRVIRPDLGSELRQSAKALRNFAQLRIEYPSLTREVAYQAFSQKRNDVPGLGEFLIGATRVMQAGRTLGERICEPGHANDCEQRIRNLFSSQLHLLDRMSPEQLGEFRSHVGVSGGRKLLVVSSLASLLALIVLFAGIILNSGSSIPRALPVIRVRPKAARSVARSRVQRRRPIRARKIRSTRSRKVV